MTSSFGDFHMEDMINGKKYLVHRLDTSGELNMSSGDIIDNNNLSVSTIFLCPSARLKSFHEQCVDLYSEKERKNMNCLELECSPYFKRESLDDKYERERLALNKHHYALPLFWCKINNDYVDYDGSSYYHKSCSLCEQYLRIGTDYCFCVKCDRIYHKECVEFPPEIKHSYHPNHPLKFMFFKEGVNCGYCQAKKASKFVYHCGQCNVSMDIFCGLKPIPFIMEQTKRHHHPLTFFTRKDHLRCNVCGLVNKIQPTYACFKCNFVSHQDCTDFPSVIRISRHNHRIYFTSSLQSRKWSCGVCRKNVDSEYGAYTCKKCDDYVVHPRCALRKDVWDGKELEGIPEDDDIEQLLEPFKTISESVILHFLHDHCLKSETIRDIYDDRKICYACGLPIYEGKFYSCMECDFILHDSCANAPRKKRHPLHPPPLTLKVTTVFDYESYFKCDACSRQSSGFVYECDTEDKCFRLDIRCGSISEPFVYQGHSHPLFLALDPQEKHSCQVCQKDDKILINCIECDFIICLKCVTLPYMVKYKHDKHFLTLVHGKETDNPNWCEVCEKLLVSSNEEEEVNNGLGDYDENWKRKYKKEKGEDIKDKRFYECKQCCTTLHINCLLGKLPYMRPGHTIDVNTDSLRLYFGTVLNTSSSRPVCHRCKDRCVDKIYYEISGAGYNYAACCLNHRY